MSIQNLLNEFIGTTDDNEKSSSQKPTAGSAMEKLSSNLPGGLMGGAAAGGVLALMMNNKKARKFAGKAATYGGAAMLGGLAYKAFKNWNHGSQAVTSNAASSTGNVLSDDSEFAEDNTLSPEFELRLIKTMIAAARADGHIDDKEQLRIMKTVREMNSSAEVRGMVFNLLSEDITVAEITNGIEDMTQKSELYLAASLIIDVDHPGEKAFLDALENALALPDGLAEQIRWQAQESMTEAA